MKEPGPARVTWMRRLIMFTTANTYRAFTVIYTCIISISPSSHPNSIISTTNIISKAQNLLPRKLSKQSSDSNLDLAVIPTWPLEHDTVLFFFYKVCVCPGCLPSDPPMSTDASSRRAQTQHLLVERCLGLPGTSCGARRVNSRSWSSSTGFMGLVGKSWLRTPGLGLAWLRGAGREGGKGKGCCECPSLCMPMRRAWQKSKHLPTRSVQGPWSVFK